MQKKTARKNHQRWNCRAYYTVLGFTTAAKQTISETATIKNFHSTA